MATVMTEVITTGSTVGLLILALRWLYSKVTKMEKAHRKDLYQSDGRTNYIPRAECLAVQESFCNKIDEIKDILNAMEEKREKSKDDYHKEQQTIAERLAGIEAKL